MSPPKHSSRESTPPPCQRSLASPPPRQRSRSPTYSNGSWMSSTCRTTDPGTPPAEFSRQQPSPPNTPMGGPTRPRPVPHHPQPLRPRRPSSHRTTTRRRLRHPRLLGQPHRAATRPSHPRRGARTRRSRRRPHRQPQPHRPASRHRPHPTVATPTPADTATRTSNDDRPWYMAGPSH